MYSIYKQYLLSKLAMNSRTFDIHLLICNSTAIRRFLITTTLLTVQLFSNKSLFRHRPHNQVPAHRFSVARHRTINTPCYRRRYEHYYGQWTVWAAAPVRIFATHGAFVFRPIVYLSKPTMYTIWSARVCRFCAIGVKLRWRTISVI